MASVSNFRPPTQAPSPQPRKPGNWGKWLLLGAAGVIGYFWLMGALRQRTFDEGLQAYAAADCATAIAKFDQVIGNQTTSSDPEDMSARAQARKAECQAFQTAKGGKSTTAQFAFATQFVQKYPNSELVTPLKQTIAPNLTKTLTKKLATPTTCQRLDLIEQQELLPANKIPEMYLACGQVFSTSRKLPQAIALYEKFLDQYPDHALTTQVKQAYAKVIVQDAKAQGGGRIAPPGAVGRTPDGSTVVSIRNDSSEAMRIVFSGPTPRVEELPPCKECRDFTAGSLPKSCPNKGELGHYTIQPGEYEVMVKSIGSRQVRPFTGSWELDGGNAYSHCFYIVRDVT